MIGPVGSSTRGPVQPSRFEMPSSREDAENILCLQPVKSMGINEPGSVNDYGKMECETDAAKARG